MPPRFVLIPAVFVAIAAHAATGPSIADFAQNPSLEMVRLSPNGDYIAAKLHFSNGPGMAVIRLADNKITASVAFGRDEDLANLWWVGPNRVVIEPAVAWGISDALGRTGELIGINADGTDQNYLFGYRGGGSTSSHIRTVGGTRAWASMVDTLWKDPLHAIIAVNNMDDNRDTQITRTYKLNVGNGLLTDEVDAPTTGDTRFLTDENGVVRYAVTRGTGTTVKTFQRNPDDKAWQAVNAGALEGARVVPLGFSRDNSKVYLMSDEGADRYCLVEQALASGIRQKLDCDDNVDLKGVIFSFDGKEPIAAVYGGGKGSVALLHTDNPDRVLLQRLQISFPNSNVYPTSYSADGSKVIIEVSSDRDPGTYYLVDTRSAKAVLIGARYETIYPDEMSERRPVTFKARDGQQLQGYLTIPQGQDLKSLPLVVHPHGGPLEIADDWRWDADSQMLASRGYAVLQINFRGSGGFGKAFIEAGRLHWGSVMIDDLTDGVHWAVSQGYADPKRLCIYGVSYGAYAALESAEREPDLYRCAVAMSGVYDLNLLHRDSDITDSRAGREAFTAVIGDSPGGLREASPVDHVDRLKAAVFIVHGGDDQRTPISQAEALMKALDARHYPYEKLIKPGEGHGFYSPQNREEFYTQLIAFLDRNIGAASQAESAKAADTGQK